MNYNENNLVERAMSPEPKKAVADERELLVRRIYNSARCCEDMACARLNLCTGGHNDLLEGIV
jgi:hypothetical protein